MSAGALAGWQGLCCRLRRQVAVFLVELFDGGSGCVGDGSSEGGDTRCDVVGRIGASTTVWLGRLGVAGSGTLAGGSVLFRSGGGGELHRVDVRVGDVDGPLCSRGSREVDAGDLVALLPEDESKGLVQETESIEMHVLVVCLASECSKLLSLRVGAVLMREDALVIAELVVLGGLKDLLGSAIKNNKNGR